MKTKLLIILSLAIVINAHAGSATWNLNPATGDWHTAANWTPATVPNGSADVASFSVSNTTAVSLSASATVNGLIFNSGASAFTITANPTRFLTISGVGITNNSGVPQNFSALSNEDADFGTFLFSGSASAGDSSVFTSHGSKKVGGSFGYGVHFTATSTAGSSTFITKADEVGGGGSVAFSDSASADHGAFVSESGNPTGVTGGTINFFDTATAGNGTFVLKGSPIVGPSGGSLYFAGTSTAGNGTFLCEGASTGPGGNSSVQLGDASTAGNAVFIAEGGTVSGAPGAHLQFGGTANGGNAIFTINGGAVAGAAGGTLLFQEGGHPSAGNATLIANSGLNGGDGGEISFAGGSGLLPDGGTARVELFGNGHLDLSLRAAGQALTVGSVEGDGIVFLGKVRLGVGTRNLDTVFSGLIQDGGAFGGSGGSLSKAGTGKLTLTGANSYTGGTTVNAGTLIVRNRTGSATGTGTVQVKSGTLGGGGTIAGTVTIGTGGISFLAPADGRAKPATLTIGGGLTLESASTYTCTFRAKGNRRQNDQVIANGVTINSAMFSFQGTVQGALQNGTVFTVINNTSANPISGTFSNLADGAIVNVNGNNFQVCYSGGDGNDLTLTVVP